MVFNYKSEIIIPGSLKQITQQHNLYTEKKSFHKKKKFSMVVLHQKKKQASFKLTFQIEKCFDKKVSLI